MNKLILTLLLIVSCGETNFSSSTARRKSGYSSGASSDPTHKVDNDLASYGPGNPYGVGNDSDGASKDKPNVGNDSDSGNGGNLL